MDDSKTKQYFLTAVRFCPGQTYESVCWFTGGTSYYKVIDREGDILFITEAHNENDGFHKCDGVSSFKIMEEDGREYIVLYSYHGEENRIYAGKH